MRIFLMCNGRQERLAGVLAHPKQRIDIGQGETVIDRTARIAHGWCAGITLVAPASDDWMFVAEAINAIEHLSPGHTDNLVQTLIASRAFDQRGDDDVVIMLGDVVYSNACLSTILGAGSEIRFVGRCGANPVTGKPYAEMFGLYVPSWRLEKMRDLAESIVNRGGRQGLWELYYALTGLLGPSKTMYLHEVKGDWSDDIDTADDLKMLATLRACAAGDDPPPGHEGDGL